MDNTNRIDEIQKELTATKERDIDALKKASAKLSFYIEKYPAISGDKGLQRMIAYAYLHVGDKIDDVIRW